MTDNVHLSLDEVHEMATKACRALGCSADQASAIADTITAAERDDCKSHGLFRLSFYARVIRSDRTQPQAVPLVYELAPAVVRVDAGFGFAPLALKIGATPLAERAHSQGIAALGVNNAFNVSALWPEVERLAAQGLVVFAFTGATSTVAPAGGTKPIYGTNPMAFGWPRRDRPPIVFDQASSATARGEIQLHLRDGKPLPEGWALGPDGKPTTDPATALEGAQLPFGGYKGAAIALMVELLAGALIGDLFSYEAKEKDTAKTGAPIGGEFMIAIDPACCVAGGDSAAQLDRAERLFAKILEQQGTRLPAQRRYEARERTKRSGVEIPGSLYEEVEAMIAGKPSP